nr:MAG TPA: hypothetical protein [Caudoviricetes sp.]
MYVVIYILFNCCLKLLKSGCFFAYSVLIFLSFCCFY